MDVLAAAIRNGLHRGRFNGTGAGLRAAFSSAKDPVNMAGFIIQNVRSGVVKQFHWHDVADLPRNGSVTLLDVREPCEFEEGHIEGFVNIPLNELREHLSGLDPAKPVYVNCYSGLRSYIACRILAGRGFDSRNLSGGWRLFEMVMKDGRGGPASEYPCGEKLR
jgi:rhodanese-related sulfurtransferase